MKSLYHLLSYLVLLLLPALYIAPAQAMEQVSEQASDSNSAEQAEQKQKPQAKNADKDKKAKPDIASLLAERQFVQGEKARGIRTHTIDTWRYLDNYHIYIDGIGRNNDYLVKFKHKCRDTRGGESLFYKTHNGQLTKFDTISVINNLGGHGSSLPSRSCFIDEIFHLEKIESTADGSETIEASDGAKAKGQSAEVLVG